MLKKSTAAPVTSAAYMKIPTVGIIFFSVLLAGTSFAAGASWIKSSNTLVSTTPKTTIDPATAKATFTTTKNDKPLLNFFVMSFCPYGNQIETALRPVFDLLGKKVDIQPRYILSKVDNLDTYCKQTSGDSAQCKTYVQSGYFQTEADCQKTIAESTKKCQDESSYLKAPTGALYTSLHGRQEANQDVRELCAWNQTEDKTLWWNFVGNVNKNCTAQNADSCWTDQAKAAGLDTNKITECFNNEGVNLIEKEIAATDQAKAYSSPTVILNGTNFPPESAWTQDGSGNIAIDKQVFTQAQFRDPNTIKAALCSAFNKAPGECKTELATTTAAAPAAASGQGCGN